MDEKDKQALIPQYLARKTQAEKPEQPSSQKRLQLAQKRSNHRGIEPLSFCRDGGERAINKAVRIDKTKPERWCNRAGECVGVLLPLRPFLPRLKAFMPLNAGKNTNVQ